MGVGRLAGRSIVDACEDGTRRAAKPSATTVKSMI
jgi:hypothetical protein